MNHYDTLEVSPLASPEVIRAAYRSLMQRFHPDRNPGDEAAATRASDVASAYEVLSDAHRRASYDASLQAAARPEIRDPPATPHDAGANARRASQVRAESAAARGHGGAAPSRRARFGFGLWSVAVVATAGGIWLSRSLTASIHPAAELASIRQAIASDATAEAERRRLYARKLAVLEQHPELMRSASAERSEDMAARTFPLLASPLAVRVGSLLPRPGPPMELTVPAASLLIGSFDAPNLLAHMARHRERLVQDLADALAKEDPDRLARPDGETHFKRIIAEAITAGLEIGVPGEYPSTYFESPGRYGVVDVLLPDRFRLVRLGSSP